MSDWYPSMTEVRLAKRAVINQLLENRKVHRQKFEEAMDGYRDEAVRVLEKHIENIKNNEPQQVYLNLPLPEDHSEDYDRAIQMLEWSLDDEVILNQREYSTYIMDDWGWKQDFDSTWAMYSS